MRWLRAALIVWAAAAGPALAAGPLEVVARIGIGAEPLGLAVTADNRILVVTAAERALYAIDASRHQTISRLDLAAHGRLNRVIADPDGRAIYVTASVAGKLLVIDWDLGAVRAVIAVGAFPQGMAILDRRLFVANTADQSISVFDTGAGRVVRTLDAGERPNTLAVSAAGRRLIVVKSTTRSLWTIDLDDYGVVNTLSNPAFTRPMDVATASGGTMLLVDGKQDKLLRLSVADGRVLSEVALADPACPECRAFTPMAVALSPDGRYAAVASRNGAISVIDLEEDRLVASRIVGRDLRDVAFLDDHRIAVTSFATGEVVVVRRTP